MSQGFASGGATRTQLRVQIPGAIQGVKEDATNCKKAQEMDFISWVSPD